MKKKSFLFILSLCLILPSLFLLSACTKTPPPDDPPAEPIKLNAPVVSLNDNIASWTSVDNAISYEVWIDSNTNTIAITITQYTLTDGQTFKVRAVGDGTNYSTSDWSNSVTYNAPTPPPTEPTELSAPVVSINESGLASWNAVANASSYKYKINNGTEQTTTLTSVQLSNGDSIVVKAVGDGTEYTDSAYSESKTYTAPIPPVEPTELNVPVVSVNSTGLASWNAVANASGYKYKINNGTEQSTTSTSVQLTDGDSIVVKAVGDGIDYSDSAYSQSVTYNAPAEPTELNVPVVSINSTGLASWNTVANASGYKYKINNGTEQSTTLTYVQLSSGDSIVVKAVGDGVDYSDSEYCGAVTFNTNLTQLSAPNITIDASGKAVWTHIQHATGFAYRINNGAEQITGYTTEDRVAQLSDGDTIIVKALGDGTTYSDSEYSESKTYTAPITPTTVTYSEIINAIEANLNAYIQASYSRGTVSNAKVVDITSNGTIIAFYNVGTGLFNASIQITGIAQATTLNEVYTLVSSTTNYGTVDNKTQMQPTEDALALVEAGMHWGVDSLDGYTMDDVSWVTATTFNSSKETTITVVLEDGTMVKYTLSVGGASSSAAAKDAYINGAAHSIYNESTSEYQSLQDKLETVTYADVVEALETKLIPVIQSAHRIGTVSEVSVHHINAKDGEVVCTYKLGSASKAVSLNISGLTTATTENVMQVIENAELTKNDLTLTSFQSNEDALALVQRGMVNGNISALNGYEIDDVSWVTATGFDSAKATDITVVFNDGKMVKYILTVSGAVSSTSAKNDYINGCAHNVSAGVVSEYQSLEDKLAVATYADVVSALQTKLTPIIQTAHVIGTVSEVSILRINAKDGEVVCTYKLGTTNRALSFTISEFITATPQNILQIIADKTIVKTDFTLLTFQPTEDALALVERGITNGNIDALDGYTKDDIVWATATTFNSAKATDITVVLEDGTMVKYTLSVGGASSSAAAKDAYINGAAHNILNETETTYQSLQDKLETVTYAEVVSAIEANLNAHIQASYSRGTVTNSNVIDISSDGTVYCTYQRGTVTYMATIQITGLENATTLNEAYTIVNLTTNYGTVDNKTQMQPTEDALALVQRGMVNGNISALNGYEIDDVSWVTATTFGSAKSTDITVVFDDGTMVEYTLTVSGAASSTSAKNDYINGAAHNVSAAVVSNYESLEDKLS